MIRANLIRLYIACRSAANHRHNVSRDLISVRIRTHHLARMDRLGIAFAFLSVSSPNLSKADRETEIHMVHQINTKGVEIVQRHTNRLGLFASLPLPYTAPAIAEAEFALSELKADGFALSTNYAGIYLGDPAYDPLLEYLDTVGAVVAVHPVNKQLHDLLLDVCAGNLLYGSDMPYTPDIACIAQTGGLETASCMNEPEKEAMFTLNAVALVPRLADILHVSATGNALCYTNAPLSIREKCSRWIRSFIARVYHVIFQ